MAGIALKKVMIPTSMDPFVVEVNGWKYEYPAGTEQEVPEEVAAVIENIEGNTPKPDPRAGEPSFESLRDKPFGEDTKVIFDQTIDFTQLSNGQYMTDGFWPIKAGDTVAVTLDGVKHECTAFNHSDEYGSMVIFGNSIIFGGDDTGEPFVGGVVPGQGSILIDLDEPTVRSVKIEKTEIHKLDPKFLPSGMGGGMTVLYNNWQYGPYAYKTPNYQEEDKLSKDELMECVRSGMVIIANIGDGWEEYYYPVVAGAEGDFAWIGTNDSGNFYSKEYVSDGGSGS
jgi:hypothetical protein